VDIADLGQGPPGGNPFLPPDLTAAVPGGIPKSGYQFTITGGTGQAVMDAADTCNGSANDTETEFFAIGDPQSSQTGTRFFATDHSGALRQGIVQLTSIDDGTPLQ
jgi:hypothetical protein